MDYIELLRGAVDCSVHLLCAQHAINTAQQRSEAARRHTFGEQDNLHQVEKTVRVALLDSARDTSPNVVSLASRILRDTGNCVETEVKELKADSLTEIALNERIVARARETSCRAVETLIVDHDIPESDLCLTLVSTGSHYTVQVIVNTPFGVSAHCGVEAPVRHEWNRPRRVGQVCPHSTLYLPRAAGLLRRRAQLASTCLDRLYITEVTLDETHALVTLRRSASGGPGYRLGVAYEPEPRIVVSRVDKQGLLDADSAITLGGKDNARALRLLRRIGESTRDLIRYRVSAACVVFDDQPLVAMDNPGRVARRLIAAVSPVARETARRSGAPGELVIRRDIGDGRREELYVTQRELFEKIQRLPPELQIEFEPLGIVPLQSVPSPRLAHG